MYTLISSFCALAVLVKLLLLMHVPLSNAFVLNNFYEYHHKSCIAKSLNFSATVLSQTVWV